MAPPETVAQPARIGPAVGAAALAAVVVLVLVATHPTTAGWPPLWVLVATCGAFAAAKGLRLRAALGSRQHSFAADEAALLLALLVLPSTAVVFCLTIGCLICEVANRKVWFKIVANVATHAAPVGVAALLFSALHGQVSARPAAWPAAVAATAVFALLNDLSISWVIAVASRDRVPRSLALALPGLVLNCAVNVGLALLALALWQVPRAGLAVVPVVAVAAWWEYRRMLRARTERDGLALLDRASRPVAALEPLPAFAEVADRAAAVLGATHVEVRLRDWPPDAAAFRFERSPGREDAWEPDPGQPDGGGTHVVPLLVGSTVLGSLVLGFDHPLSNQERHVVNAFAATVAAAADHARGYAVATWAATHDGLTGLANRAGLAAQLTETLRGQWPAQIETGRPAPLAEEGIDALLLLDLDHFKEVNDTLGHEAGDRLLVEVGRRLSGCVRDYDFVARLGGDEFAVLLRRLHDPESAMQTGAWLLGRLSEPVELDGLRLPLEGSVGVALVGVDGDTVDGVLRCADIAMYEAKRRRNAVVRYAPEQDTSSPERLALIGELQTGLRRGELLLHYQPKVDLRTGRLAGAEALVRWQHPTRGLLAPGAFIPAVERTGLVLELTLEVLDLAVREAVQWQRTHVLGAPVATIAVNVSRRCLVHRDFPQEVTAVLLRHGLPGGALTLEITETLELAELEVVEDVLTRLRELGVHLSVDDFGTGYSSMSFFQRVRVDEVKVDGSFVQAMDRSSSARAIVRSTLELGHGVGLPVVAEGVETAGQLDELIAMGCDAGQGYFLGRPMPGHLLRELLGRLSPPVVAALAARRDPQVTAGPARPLAPAGRD